MIFRYWRAVLMVFLLINFNSSTSFQNDSCTQEIPTFACSDDIPLLIVDFDQVSMNSCGGHYHPSLLKSIVGVTWEDADEEKNYVVMMVDPDAKGLQGDNVFIHWMRWGIKGVDIVLGMQVSGKENAKYIPPNPKPGAKAHRYSIYLYEESLSPNPEFQPLPREIKKRKEFDIMKYTKDFKFCGPLAHNIFYANL
ncbi:putative odorant-binding protein A5 isoform X1 [Procambarus clarkii]|uniref:putative odorant-binding protein A5 isoform X1 n=1 Tax=Procambarus clarkii TaxID=6728 RepID=UPI001E67849B|nr:putative odorant-binding protein A5 [Procambarus clarkii]